MLVDGKFFLYIYIYLALEYYYDERPRLVERYDVIRRWYAFRESALLRNRVSIHNNNMGNYEWPMLKPIVPISRLWRIPWLFFFCAATHAMKKFFLLLSTLDEHKNDTMETIYIRTPKILCIIIGHLLFYITIIICGKSLKFQILAVL